MVLHNLFGAIILCMTLCFALCAPTHADSVNFRYNDRSEIVEVSTTNGVIFAWNYDLAGNLISSVVNGTTNFFTCNSLNQYTFKC